MEKQQAVCRYAWLLSFGLLLMATWPLDLRHKIFCILAWLVGSTALARHEYLRVWLAVDKLSKPGGK